MLLITDCYWVTKLNIKVLQKRYCTQSNFNTQPLSVTMGFSCLSVRGTGESWMRGNEITATILAGKIGLNSLARKSRYNPGCRDLTTNWTDSSSNKSTWWKHQFIPTKFLSKNITRAVAYIRFAHDAPIVNWVYNKCAQTLIWKAIAVIGFEPAVKYSFV